MKILRLSTVALTIVLFTMGALILPVDTASAHCTGKGKHTVENGCEDNPHGGGDDPPATGGCDRDNGGFCIVSVGKSLRPAVIDYIAAAESGSYSAMGSGRFGEILGSFDAITQLCDDFDVVIVEWSNPPNMKNLSWANLDHYMDCGGGIIFEDPRNVVALDSHVTTEEINFHSTEEGPIEIIFEPVCGGPTAGPPLSIDCMSTGAVLPAVNQHMTFDEDASHNDLKSFLSLVSTDVVGLFGEFGTGGIIVSGLDNGFHGNCNPLPLGDPINPARINQAKLLANEINWLLSLNSNDPVETVVCE